MYIAYIHFELGGLWERGPPLPVSLVRMFADIRRLFWSFQG